MQMKNKFSILLLCMSFAIVKCGEVNKTQINVITTWPDTQFVATTPSIKNIKAATHNEDDDDDNDEGDEDNVILKYSNSLNSSSQTQVNPKPNALVMVFNTLSNAIINTALRGATQKATESYKDDDDEEYETSSEQIIDERGGNDKKEVFQGRQAGASYIKGDPLNGYYDFVITEGSYKFWVVFQLFTAGLLIYSTLAAIYYSKVNPLTSDYDYVDYLSRSFHGRSLDSEDVLDDDDVPAGREVDSAHTYLSSLGNNKWVKTAAYGFQFAMDAIDRIPK